ncbi:hypothetical protein RFI_12943 [Reticulomyxa filosa]|uniref:Uncharacterized protein n=1 Tax=Reticulomyxa filosa TaxID=46433 RepID=X6NFV5_RETFI|nr:hypothetical protein RFI_12943 [Reticulomyxa filosa]|eukprot:ETO24222.1 hypothetical protein RFI_12943 [Reticulomyxa filosa]
MFNADIRLPQERTVKKKQNKQKINNQTLEQSKEVALFQNLLHLHQVDKIDLGKKGDNAITLLPKMGEALFKNEYYKTGANQQIERRQFQTIYERVDLAGKTITNNKQAVSTVHADWKEELSGADSPWTESETWGIIAHINKRHSYGKSLRFSDRFFARWSKLTSFDADENTSSFRSAPKK